MAISVTSVVPTEFAQVPGLSADGRRRSVRKWTLASTYATGGYAYKAGADFGLGRVQLIRTIGPFTDGTGLVIPVWDDTNAKIMFFWDGEGGSAAAFVQVTNGTSLASYVGFIEAEGI